jgi:trans-aconitate 2-methyltransferase
MPWDPQRYQQFKHERSAPFWDLLALVEVRPGLKVLDLGCGTGELTRQLADRLVESEVLGIDSSSEMLAKTSQYARPGLRFERGRIEETSGTWDVVFSNAAIQWVEDHYTLMPHLLSLVNPGGQLAVQLPSNQDHPTHRLIIETAQEVPFRQALDGWTRQVPVLPVDTYAELLYQNGGEKLVVFEKIYPHVLENADALADWTSGTALVPYFERLGPELKESFMQRYRQKLRQRFPGSPVFYGFRRILFSAQQPLPESDLSPNPVTRSLLRQAQDPRLREFVQQWDALEGLVLRLYRQKEASVEDEQAYQRLRAWLATEYPHWQDVLKLYWRATRIKDQPLSNDPFLLVLSVAQADGFINNRAALQTLPAARETINEYLLTLS